MPRPRKDKPCLPAVRRAVSGSRFTCKTSLSRSELIAIELRRLLAEGRYETGDLFPSQNELARMFATSTVTSREAVLLLVKEGLLERRFGSGTYVTGRAPERFVAVVTELDISHPAVSPSYLVMLQSVRRHLAEAGLQTRLYMGHSDPTDPAEPERISSWEFWHDLEADRITGLVTVGTDARLGRAAVEGRGIPFIDSIKLDGIPFWDTSSLIDLGMRTLAARGCRRVACMGAGRDTSPELAARSSREAARNGLQLPSEWVVQVPRLHDHGDGAAAFHQLWMSRDAHPDGLLVLDDLLYRDVAPVFLLNGIRVPGDLIVVSHANANDLRPFVPEPVRLVADMERVGAAVARNMVLRLSNLKAPPEGIPVPVQIMEPATAPHEALVFPSVRDGAGRALVQREVRR